MKKPQLHPYLNMQCSLHDVFPTLTFDRVEAPDMSVGSTFFGTDPVHENLETAQHRLDLFQKQHPDGLIANGYLEARSFYNTDRYQRSTSNGKEYRNIHLGTDFWVPARTPLHSPLPGKVVISHNNDIHKDYGPLVVLEHRWNEHLFYTLYGHLSEDSLANAPIGKHIEKGTQIGWIGAAAENGDWVPHLHFQILTHLLGNTENYPGTAYPSELDHWMELCPNPDLLFKEHLPQGPAVRLAPSWS